MGCVFLFQWVKKKNKKKIKSPIQILLCLIEIFYSDIFLDFVQVYSYFFPSQLNKLSTGLSIVSF